MTEAAKKNIVVIGSGIVGACSALELVRDGHQVTLLDIGKAGGRQAASYGHGCWISPASVVPMSTPGLWKKIPGFLLDRRGPLVIRWRNLIQLLPWLLRFLVAGSSLRRVEATALALDKLLHDSPERHEALALEVGSPALIRKEGLLYVYPDRQAFEEEKISWRLRKLTGLRWQELDKPALKAREPGLDNRYGFGILAERGAHCVDPGAYVAKIVDKVRERGGQIIHTKATGFHLKDGRLQGVETEFGILACNAAVVSAGAWSKPLALDAGDHVFLESERGYHTVLKIDGEGPRHPIMPSDGKMANTPTLAGLRLSGQVELASINAEPNWERADILVEHARTSYPALNTAGLRILDRWMGHRPSTPDGLPVIGRSTVSPDVFYAFGHGHVGFASGPMTGKIVANYFGGRRTALDLSAYSPRRFSRKRRKLERALS